MHSNNLRNLADWIDPSVLDQWIQWRRFKEADDGEEQLQSIRALLAMYHLSGGGAPPPLSHRQLVLTLIFCTEAGPIASQIALSQRPPMEELVFAAGVAFQRGRLESFVQRLSALTVADDIRRRSAYAALRASPRLFLAYRTYLQSLSRPSLMIQVIAIAARTFDEDPDLSAELADLVPMQSDRAVLATLLPIYEEQQSLDRLKGWGALLIARKLMRLDRPEAAIKIVSRALGPEAQEGLKFELLSLLAEARHALKDNNGELKALVTSLVVQPQHVKKASILNRIVELLPVTVPEYKRTYVYSEVYRGSADYSIEDNIPFLSNKVISSLCLNEVLSEDEHSAFVRAQAIGASNAWQVVPAGEFRLSPPSPVAGALEQSEILALFGRPRTSFRRPLDAARALNVSFHFGDNFLLYVDEGGRIVPAISTGYACFFSERILRGKEVVVVEEPALNCSLHYGRFNFSHFLLDRLPRLGLCDLNARVVFVEEDMIEGFRAFCKILGLEQDVRGLSPEKVYHFKDVIGFGTTQHPAQGAAPEFLNNLRKAVTSDRSQVKRRIFIDRPQGRRGVENRGQVLEILSHFDFEIINFESYSLIDQIDLCASASIIAGLHGAGLSNIAFADRRTKILEVAPTHYWTSAYYILASEMGCEYFAMFAPPSNLARVPDQFSDLWVDPDQLARVLDRMVAATAMNADLNIGAESV
jgi:hypothetical protein